MIKYTDTTVFNVRAKTIVNTVNCVGVMGAGLALEYQLRCPEMYQDYVKRCNRKAVTTGRPYLYKGYGNPWIMNFPTKNHWKYPSKIEWIEQGLDYFVKNYERGGITSIAFPKLGCENGGLNWNDVQNLMEKYFQNIGIEVYICLDQELEASGIEGIMTNLANNKQDLFWISALGIKDDIATKILDSLPIRRFRELRKIAGVGKQTYNELFKLLYSIAVKRDYERYQDTDVVEMNHSITETFEPAQLVEKEPLIHSQVNGEDTITNHIISAPEAKSRLVLDTNQRNHVMLLLKDTLCLEATELSKLKWFDFKNHEDKGQVTVLGKVIPAWVWQEIQSIRGNAGLDDPVFCKSKGGHLSTSSVKKIISDAAKNAEKPTQLELDLVY
jgi:O-acetyl-ADP-ribose deacetylase (regulator of RNase III)